MTDRPASPRFDLPHLVVPGEPSAEPFQRRAGGGGGGRLWQVSDRRSHAAQLKASLEGAVAAAGQLRVEWTEELRAQGLVLSVVGWPGGFELAIESLDLRRSGVELLSVSRASQNPESPELATVFVPDAKMSLFFSRLDRYATEETVGGKPKHEGLVANISAMQLASIEQLWTDAAPFPATDEARWWELWLRRTGDELGVLGQIASSAQWELADRAVEFPNRTVTAVRSTTATLASALASRLPIAEVRHASLVHSVAQLAPLEQRQWVTDLASRLRPASTDAPAVCLLDTGIYHHSLFEGSLAPSDSYHVVGSDGADRDGHGTEMAGVALFGDLAEALTASSAVYLPHRIESVKILPDVGANPRETYGAVTASGIATPEAATPGRRRVFLLANSDHSSDIDGRPTLWSATVDALAFGTDVLTRDGSLELLSDPDPGGSRLVVVAAGNVRDEFRLEYLDRCDMAPVEDPGQAFNALTVGAFTEKTDVPGDPAFRGYTTLARAGQLAPFSRTSVRYSDVWPIKPDILLEGGNLVVSPSATSFDRHDAVMLTTTSRLEPLGRPFTSTGETSAAAAQAARMAAAASAAYPNLWPESLRGLLVHSAEWSEPMAVAVRSVRTKTERARLLRRYGYGVPTLDRVLRSASSAVTLIAQSEIQPFEQRSVSETRLREMHLHDVPWPRDQLLELGDAPVRMRVTLSYFVEPNPSSRGWRGRYVYPSHGLRFDVRRPGETTGEFRRRLNRLAEVEESHVRGSTGSEPNWMVGPTARHRGSLHADVWEGTGAELADSGVLGVYPVGGWWKANNRFERNELRVRYSLLISLHTPLVEVDLYSPIAVQIGVPIPIET